MPKSKTNKLKPGTKFSRLSYGEVVAVRGASVHVKNEDGMDWTISAGIFEEEFYTPDQYTEVKEVNRTEMIEAILSNPRVAMTVSFKKKPELRAIKELVSGLWDDAAGGAKKPGPVVLGRKLKPVLEGEERTMIGRHYGAQDDTGRLQFHDMEASGHPLRQVDPRTVYEAVIANVKYVLK